MKKLLIPLIAIITFLFGQDIYGEKIFRDGYIVKKNGVIMNGKIEYSVNQDIPNVCSFKRFDIARKVTYSPEDILAFGYINGNRYESKKVNKISSFYEVIVTGKIILYRKGSKFFIDKEHQGMVELKNGSVSYPAGGGKTEFKSLPEFLDFITGEKTGKVSEKFNLKNDIIPLITSYDKQDGKEFYVFNRTMSEKQLNQQIVVSGAYKNNFGFLTGVNTYMFNMKFNPNVSGLDKTGFLPSSENNISPVTGLTFERVLFRRTERISLRVDLLLTKQSFYFYGERTNSHGEITRDDAYFNFTGIKVPLLLQYSVKGKRIVPFINAGIAYQKRFNNYYHHIQEAEDVWHTINTSEDNEMHISNSEITKVGGIGIRTRLINNLTLHLMGRVEFGSGLFVNSSKAMPLYTKKDPFIQNTIQSALLLGLTF
jgi:hypothetical protein